MAPSPQASSTPKQVVVPLLLFIVLGAFIAFGGLTSNLSFSFFFLFLLGMGFLVLSFFSITTGLVVMTLAMLFSPEFKIGMIGARELTVRLEDGLIPILMMASVARLAILKEYRLLSSSPLNAPIFLLLALSFVSTFRGAMLGALSLMPALFYILKTIEFFCIFFFVFNYVRTEKQIRFFLSFTILAVCLVGIYTLTQVPNVEIFSEHRITAPFEGTPEPATIGGYMAFLLLIIFSLFLYEKKIWIRWLYGVVGLIVFIPFVYTLNRTSYIALLCGFVFIAFVERRRSLVFFIIAILLLAPIVMPAIVKERLLFTLTDAINPGRDLGVDHSLQERIYVYRRMWNTLKYSPLIGFGMTSYQTVDSQYARTLHEIGIIGLGIWLWIFWRLFRMSQWLFNTLEGGYRKGMVLGYRAGLVGILLHGFGAITFYIVRIMEPFWFITGLIVSLYFLKLREDQAALAEVEEESSA